MQQDHCLEKVPTEIWAEVFQHAQRTLLLEGTYKETRFTKCDIPISISGVCSRFRQIAIGTPQLWISIVVDMSSRHPLSPPLAVTKLWLERSKNSPLSILIYNMSGMDLQNDSEKREVFLLLLSHLGRWREARLEWSNTNRDFWERVGILDRAPLLESLILKPRVDEDQIRHALLPSKLWAGSPRLRKLVVSLWVSVEDEDEYYLPRGGFSSWATLNNIPYEKITHLHLDATTHEIISCKEISSIFKRASNLVCCFLKGISDPDRLMMRQFDPLLLSHLCHLCLEVADDEFTINTLRCSQILNLITAPSLLLLTVVNQSEVWDYQAFENFIVRSSCPLEELNLVDIHMMLAGLHICMTLVGSSLRTLHVSRVTTVNTQSTNAFIADMGEWNPATNMFSFCPHLQRMYLCPRSIILSPRNQQPSTLKLVARMLKPRLQPQAGGSKTFKTYVLASRWVGAIPVELSELTNDPFNLELEFNDQMSNDTTRSAQLWRRLAYQS